MKKLALLLSLAVAGSAAHLIAEDATTAPKPADAKAAHAAKAADKLAGKTHDVTAEVVPVDATKSTLTIKGDPATAGSPDKTVPVDAKATASLKDLKAGDKVTLTCWDDSKGEHKKVVGIAPVKM